MHTLALTFDDITEVFQRRYGRGRYHASAWFRAQYQTPPVQVSDLPIFTRHPTLVDQIRQDFIIELPRIVERLDQEGVTKLILALRDGLEIETVIIPMPHYATICISSQAGCRMGCRFCRTGRMGFRRQLAAEEIVAQVYLAQVVIGFDVRNVVFMGMGEPLDNWSAVLQAVRVLNDQRGLDIPLRRMTISTIGRIPDLKRLADSGRVRPGIAISLNTPDDDARHHLMPATRPHTLHDLKRTLLAYPLTRGSVFFISYVLIRNVNDSEAHARRTAAFLHGLPVKLNLIPFNPGEDSLYTTPPMNRIEKFRQILIDARIFVRLRGTKGDKIQAACGQLGRSGM